MYLCCKRSCVVKVSDASLYLSLSLSLSLASFTGSSVMTGVYSSFAQQPHRRWDFVHGNANTASSSMQPHI